MEESAEKKVIDKTTESINKIIDEGLNTNNLETLYKLSKIKHMAKEDENMNNYGNYGNYNGRGPGHGSYGRYGEYNEYGNYGRDSYGRRGRDMRYRGDDYLDKMYEDYGRYEEGRQRYGANEDTKKSLEYMLRSMEDFARMLKEEAQSQEEVNMIKQTAQRIAQM